MAARDKSFAILERLQLADTRLRVIRFRRNFGQTAAFSAGFAHARGRMIVTSDGDLQNDPRDIPALAKKLEDEQLDIVCGWRRNRKDAFVSRLVPSFFANGLISWATGVKLHDYGCSLKVFRAEVVKPIKLYGEMHRFIPAIASEQGVAIGEAVVNHRPRLHGRSKYGISRTIRVVLDLLTVKFLLSYSTRPLQIFGLVGLAMSIPGVLIMAYLTFIKFGMGAVDCQPSAVDVRHPARLHRRSAPDAGIDGRTAGAHLSRVAGQADLRHPRNPRERPRLPRLPGNTIAPEVMAVRQADVALAGGQAATSDGLGGAARDVGRRVRRRPRRDRPRLCAPGIDTAGPSHILAPSVRRLRADGGQPGGEKRPLDLSPAPC